MGLNAILLWAASSTIAIVPTADLFFSQTSEIIEEYKEYSNSEFNKMVNEESDTMEPVIDNYAVDLETRIMQLIGEKEVGFDEKNYAYEYLEEFRKCDEYELALKTSYNFQNSDAIKCILMFLASIDFKNISAFEERFVVDVLSMGELNVQEFALNTILVWDNVSNINSLKNIVIKNRYLAQDLSDFIENFM